MSTPAGWYDDGSGRQRWWDGTAWTQQFAGEQSVAPEFVADAGLPSVLAQELLMVAVRRRVWAWIVIGVGLVLSGVIFSLNGDPTGLVLGCVYVAFMGVFLTVSYVAVKRRTAIAYPVGSTPRWQVQEDKIITASAMGNGTIQLANVQRVTVTERVVIVKFRTGGTVGVPRQMLDPYSLERLRDAATANRKHRKS